ncbi:S-layer family protein [Salarchaeum sp. JOR-1]|uniref:beta strand repeat-containing protein n=1 Tax=Salarchaeum sp. JOR-1 TaxID=2599399 RepID=UPI001198C37C|nr:Ig-like domain-containing protein [Salarchaeum sp. JOR-1]QDX40795.1 hypothetical protein FQU85_07695 [Salarchaeum sp. JOR-1]
MSDTRTKIRSLFLTLLMIGSVFGGTIAFTGAAAATNNAAGNASIVEYVGQNTFDNEKATVNVSINASTGHTVNASSIDVIVSPSDGNDIVLVNSGVLKNGTSLSNSTFANGNNETVEYVNVSVALPEDLGDYKVQTSANTTNGSTISTTVNDNFTVDMEPTQLHVEASGAFAVEDGENVNQAESDEIAEVRVYAVDKFGNYVESFDSYLGSSFNQLSLISDDSSVTIQKGSNKSDSAGFEYVNYSVFDTQVETVTLTAYDTDSTKALNSGSGQLTFSGSIAGVEVTSNVTEIAANGSATANVTLQLVNANGEPIHRSGVNVAWSFDNATAANVSSVQSSGTTSAQGEAYITFTATKPGVTVTITGIEQKNGNADSTTVATVTGPISPNQSSFTVSSHKKEFTAQVNSTHTATVTLRDGGNNPISGETVKFTVNGTVVATNTTNDKGVATAKLTLGTEKKDYQINASVAGWSPEPSVLVETTAAPVEELQFTTDSRVVAAESTLDVTIQAVDEFGNVNTSVTSETITLNSSDDSTIFVQDADNTKQITSGNVTFTIEANATEGSATLTATTTLANVTNTSGTWSIQTASQLNVTFTPETLTVSDAPGAVNATKIKAQLVGPDGKPLPIAGEKITFGRLSGNAAKLNTTSDTTNQNGVAWVWVNATSNTGTTEFIAQAQNYTAQGSATITTTGAVDRLVVTPNKTTVEPGTNVSVSFKFVDSQGRTVPFMDTVSLNTDLGKMVPQTVELNASNEFTATAMLTNVSADGTATITAIADSAGAASQATVTFETTTANVSVTDSTVSNTTVVTGENITVTATVSNTGNAEGSLNVTLSTDGNVTASQTVTVAAGATTTVEFTTSFSATGNHTVAVNGLAATTITVNAEDQLTPVEELAAQYDTNNNGQLGTTEFLSAVSAWQNDEIGTSNFLELVTYWQESMTVPTPS